MDEQKENVEAPEVEKTEQKLKGAQPPTPGSGPRTSYKSPNGWSKMKEPQNGISE